MQRALASVWLWAALSFLAGLHCAADLRLLPDSRDYIEAAGHLASGAGFVTHVLDDGSRQIPDPRLHHPPAYSVLLAILQMPGLTLLTALRIAAVLCFTGTAILIWFLAKCLVGRRAPAVMALFLGSSALYEPWTYGMSEALFQFLAAACLLWLARHPRPRLDSWAIAGALAGLATLCRWIGASLLIAAVLWLWPRRRRRDAWLAAIAMAASYALVVGPWLARNALLTGRLIGKVSEPSHIPVWLTLTAFSRTLLLDLAPALAVLLLAWAAGRAASISRTERLLALWAVAYSAVLLFMAAISFIDPISTRLTLPLYLALIPLCASQSLRRLRPATLRPVAVALAATLVLAASVFQITNGLRRAALEPVSVSSPLSAWLATHTPPQSLIVNPSGAPIYFPAAGPRYSYVRFFHLHDMDPAQPRRFVERFPGRFPALFAVLPAAVAKEPWLARWQDTWRMELLAELDGAAVAPAPAQRWRIYRIAAP